MSFKCVSLGKLLKALQVDARERRKMLREDVVKVRAINSGVNSSAGGDFYGPFWADAKNYVARAADPQSRLDLRSMTKARIDTNARRERLYPLLCDGFLLWWEEKRRRRNEPFAIIPETVKARYVVTGLGTIKVENTVPITIGEDGHRIFSPYFCLEAALTPDVARLGLWVMSQCITGYALQDMRILDVFNSRSFSIIDTPLLGDEEQMLTTQYQSLLTQWQSIYDELS